MRARVLLDTGPVVALLNARDRYHDWTKRIFTSITPPLLSCEAVLSEACHILRRGGGDAEAVIALVDNGTVDVAFDLGEHAQAVRKLVHRYRNVPVSLADACLVRMSEIYENVELMTFDSDFRIYRRHGRQAIPLVTPTVD